MTIHLQTSVPGPRSQALQEQRLREVPRGPAHATPVFIARAHGAQVEDVDGNRLLDFTSGIGVVNLGHTPERVVRAIQQQAERLLHAGFHVAAYQGYLEVASRLNQLAPGKFAKKTLLVNTGAEAVENAVKIARAHTGRRRVMAFEGGFHGRTYMALALTHRESPYKLGFGPFSPEVDHSPFPDTARWPNEAQRVSEECFSAFRHRMENLGPDQVAAVIIEPVQGEGGFAVAPREFLAALREYCTHHEILLVADEIQSGFGRTGTLFACEQLDLEPDLLLTAKGLAGGLPLAAVTGRAEVMDAPVPGGLGGTFGGNPVSCAAALAVLEAFESPRLLENASRLGARLRLRLENWRERFSHIGPVRGLGAMRAFELVQNRDGAQPFPEAAAQLVRFAYQHGLLVLTAGATRSCIRFLMPLVTTLEELDEGLDVLEAGLEQIHSR